MYGLALCLVRVGQPKRLPVPREILENGISLMNCIGMRVISRFDNDVHHFPFLALVE